MTATTNAEARRAMVLNQLRPQGVTDTAVLAAMGAIDRAAHLPPSLAAAAYGDRPLVLADGSPVLAPAELGRLLSAIAPRAGETALVIGRGGSYSTSVLEQIGLSVQRADTLDGIAGRFDIILVEGALDHVPSALATHLNAGGRFAAAIAERGVARLSIGRPDGRQLAMRAFADTQLPLLPGTARPAAFVF